MGSRFAAVVVSLFLVLSDPNVSAFVPRQLEQRNIIHQPWITAAVTASTRSSLVVLRVIDVDAVTNAVSIDQIPRSTAPLPAIVPTPPPPPPKVEEPLILPSSSEPLTASLPSTTAPPPVPPPTEPAPAPVAPTSSLAVPAVSTPPPPPPSEITLDLPLPALGVGILAAFAAATFAMRGSVNERDEAGSSATTASSSSPPSASSPSSTTSPDLTIPYDAAARLAYESSNKSLDYDSFREKYEADAIADVKSKRK